MTDDDLGLDPAAAALYHSADAALILSPTRGVVWASPATENVLGLTSSELLGAFATDVIHPDHVALAIHHRQVALKNGRSGPEEIQGRHGSSGYRWYTAEWWSARSGDGSEPELVVMHLRDAEEVRDARSAVLRSEARLLRLYRTSVDITMIIDQSGSTT
ncbi:MAG: PAS domain-containing protein, partial [Actinomycetota bacterium]